MASRDCFELPGGRIIRLSGIDLMSLPFEGVMYRGRFLPVAMAEAQMTEDKLKEAERTERLSRRYFGFTLTMRGGAEVPVIGTSKVNADGWHHQLKGQLIN